MSAISILAVDDEPAIRKLLDRGLTGYGYNVTTASSGLEALTVAAQQSPDIILLDVNLESALDGMDVCRQIREWTDTPIIMLTVRDEKQMKLDALNSGADDYLTKPFDMEELEARIRAVLRRSANERQDASASEIQVEGLAINFANRRVMLNGDEIHLTPKEYDLLRLLATHPGKVLTFRVLFEEIWGRKHTANPEQNVRVYVNTLRKKLRDDPTTRTKPRFIFNEPGIGYRFADL